ncbi:DUF4949 domain-containing protein [Legionella drozanskii]|uniref:Hemin binding protein n=1 Tax=Legionella drozanskii LLAP-1 TaxID=1212489 RepID=A0A0W0SQ53_9GAMM|nr:DUF4949 domain-containing protein [Legionella drozanskii]KTC85438.1 hemin binding protein [Legionella drozanskii LLAP-1]
MTAKIISAALLFSLSQISFSAPEKPNNCPTVAALQGVGINFMHKDGDIWYGSVASVNFDTNETWSLVIGEFKAKHEKDAQAKANEALSSLTLTQGPLPFNMNGKDSWVCLYKDQSGHLASAVTPSMDVASLAKQIRF